VWASFTVNTLSTKPLNLGVFLKRYDSLCLALISRKEGHIYSLITIKRQGNTSSGERQIIGQVYREHNVKSK
jgi:hypothetical protein